jgi:hypothetical protein
LKTAPVELMHLSISVVSGHLIKKVKQIYEQEAKEVKRRWCVKP